MSKRVRKLLELTYILAPFQLRMASQSLVEPHGMVADVPIRIAGIKF